MRSRLRVPIVRALVAALVLMSGLGASAPALADEPTVVVSGNVSLGTLGNHPGSLARVTWRYFTGSAWVSGPAQGVDTDAAGNYSISVPSSSVELRYGSYALGYQSTYWGGDVPTLLAVGSTPVSGVDVTLPIMGSISGHVSLGSAAVSAGAGEVRIGYQVCYPLVGCVSSAPPTVLTDASGNFVFPGLYNGVYTLTFTYLGTALFQSPATRSVTVSAAQPTQTGADATMPTAASLSGVVYLGSPAAHAGSAEVTVSIKRLGNNGSFENAITAHTNADGLYTFPSLAAGSYRVQFVYAGTGGYASQWFSNTPFETSGQLVQLGSSSVVKDATLAAGGTIAGTVRSHAGVGISGVTVRAKTINPATHSNVQIGQATTAADGTYSIANLPAGTYVLEFYHSNYPQQYMGADPLHPERPSSVVVTGGATAGGIDQTLYAMAIIQGSVSCASCSMAGVAGNVVVVLERQTATGWVQSRTTSIWAGNFAYDFRPLVPGTYRVHLQSISGRAVKPATSEPVVIVENDLEYVNLAVEFRPAVKDFTGDGFADVMASDQGGALLLYRGDGAGGWGASAQIGSGWSNMTAMLMPGDFDGDGFADLVGRDAAGYLILYRGNGSGGWAGSVIIGSGWNALNNMFSPGDFTGDGYVDLLARDSGGLLLLYPSNGAGGWLPGQVIGSGWGGFKTIFSPGDFNGDGFADVLGTDANGYLLLYPGNGAGGWLPGSVIGSGWSSMTAVFSPGDFTGDGLADVIGRDNRGNLLLYPGNGAGGWLPASVIGTGWTGLRFVG